MKLLDKTLLLLKWTRLAIIFSYGTVYNVCEWQVHDPFNECCRGVLFVFHKSLHTFPFEFRSFTLAELKRLKVTYNHLIVLCWKGNTWRPSNFQTTSIISYRVEYRRCFAYFITILLKMNCSIFALWQFKCHYAVLCPLVHIPTADYQKMSLKNPLRYLASFLSQLDPLNTISYQGLQRIFPLDLPCLLFRLKVYPKEF